VSITLEFDKAKLLLQDVVDEFGRDYKYDFGATEETKLYGCLYFMDDTTPGCIVGQVLARLGVTRSSIGSMNVSTNVENLRQRGFLNADDKTVDLLARAQAQQDDGKTWGAALDFALSTVEDAP
jgi:hypothetical protein